MTPPRVSMPKPIGPGETLSTRVIHVLVRKRCQRGWSGYIIAAMFGVPHSSIAKLESGKTPHPSLERLERYASCLGLRLSEIIAEAERIP